MDLRHILVFHNHGSFVTITTTPELVRMKSEQRHFADATEYGFRVHLTDYPISQRPSFVRHNGEFATGSFGTVTIGEFRGVSGRREFRDGVSGQSP